jgi:hypothetical protein
MTDIDDTDGQKTAAQIMWGRLTAPEREATMAHLLAHTAVTGSVIWEAIEAGIKVASQRAYVAAQNGDASADETGPRRRARRTKAEMAARGQALTDAVVPAPVAAPSVPPMPLGHLPNGPTNPFIGAMH